MGFELERDIDQHGGVEPFSTEEGARETVSTTPPSRPSRPPMGTSEPTPPLKAFFDIPIQFSLPDELATEVDQLARAAKKGEKEWLDIYNGAVRIVETLIERTDRDPGDSRGRLQCPGRLSDQAGACGRASQRDR